jgi:hypothetical protein
MHRLAGSNRPSHLVGFDQAGWRRQVSQEADKWAQAVSRVLFLENNKKDPRKRNSNL